MSLLNTILSAQGGGVVNELANRFGISPEQAQNAVSTLMPAITGKMQENASNPEGMAGIANAVSSGNHQQFLDDPSQLSSPQAVQEGHGILGHLFGNSQAPDQIADQASQETGLHPGLLKSMLPVVASLAMGALSKNAEGTAGQQGEGAGGWMGALGSALGGSQGGNLQGALGSFLGGQEGAQQGNQGGGQEARQEDTDQENAGPENADREEDSGGGGLLDMAKKFFS